MDPQDRFDQRLLEPFSHDLLDHSARIWNPRCLELSGPRGFHVGEHLPSGAQHKHESGQTHVERLCDSIASEILMPRAAFLHDADSIGWSLSSLMSLASMYQTSISATAIRMVDLMPRACVLGVWRLPDENSTSPKLQWSHSQDFRYGVQGLARDDLIGLVTEASNSPRMVTGAAPIIDKRRQRKRPPGVTAEALAWGQGLNRQVMVFYYP